MTTYYRYGQYGNYASKVPLSRTPVPIAYSYEVIVPRSSLPLTLDEVKEHLNIPLTFTDDDAYLTLLIEAVTDYFECFTNRTLINTTYRTYRDHFPSCGECYVLRKSKVDPVTVSIDYKKDGSLVTVGVDVYYVTNETGYPGIYTFPNKNWPSDADKVVQAIQIDFVAGFGPDESSIPSKIKIALLNHIAALYVNRGDCDSDGCASALPQASGLIYGQYKILSTSGFSVCRGC